MNNLLKNKTPLKGNIYGFFPNLQTYQGTRGKLDQIWTTTIEQFYILKEQEIIIIFKWEGSLYNCQLKKVNGTNFQGRIICEGELVGSAYYTLYKNKKGYCLLGTWNEDEINYDSFIEIRKT